MQFWAKYEIMLQVKVFTFNAFSENTYVLYEENGDGIIIDPGCQEAYEQELLVDFIRENNISLKRLILTHGHLDHVAGNAFIFDTYGLKPEIHEKDKRILTSAGQYGVVFGMIIRDSPLPEHYIEADSIIRFGKGHTLKALFTPGHSPGHLSFYSEADGFVIAGDALLQGSVGRTDLPGGHGPTLLESIQRELMSLPDNTIVYSGHGPATTIGAERKHNPFLQAGGLALMG